MPVVGLAIGSDASDAVVRSDDRLRSFGVLRMPQDDSDF
jgi:hypothetical protein